MRITLQERLPTEIARKRGGPVQLAGAPQDAFPPAQGVGACAKVGIEAPHGVEQGFEVGEVLLR